MTTRPTAHPPIAQVIANAVASDQLRPSLAEQFSAMGEGVQSRMFRVLDVVADQSHEEKRETQVLLTALRRLDGVSTEVADLLAALESLVFYVDRIATPDQDQGLAERYLAEYAEREG